MILMPLHDCELRESNFAPIIFFWKNFSRRVAPRSTTLRWILWTEVKLSRAQLHFCRRWSCSGFLSPLLCCRHDSFCRQTLFSNSQPKILGNVFFISAQTFLTLKKHITCICSIQNHQKIHSSEWMLPGSCSRLCRYCPSNSELRIGGRFVMWIMLTLRIVSWPNRSFSWGRVRHLKRQAAWIKQVRFSF